MNKKGIIFAVIAVFAISAAASAQGKVPSTGPESLQYKYEAYKAKDAKEHKNSETIIAKELNDKLQKHYSDKAKENQVKKVAALSEKQKMQALVAKIPASEKARIDVMVNSSDYNKIVNEIKRNYLVNDESKYYALTQTAKKDGKGLISFGTLDVAQAIINTSLDSKTYLVKVAKSYENAVHNSGNAL